jgi:hypothetical protein
LILPRKTQVGKCHGGSSKTGECPPTALRGGVNPLSNTGPAPPTKKLTLVQASPSENFLPLASCLCLSSAAALCSFPLPMLQTTWHLRALHLSLQA